MTQRPQKLSRRGAIKLGAQSAVAATAATACKTPGNSSALSESKVETAHCLVLGAGVAGLTAASMLESHWQGRGKVVVLEGSGRAGGRIWTLRNTFAGPVELGAEFIHRDSLDVTLWDAVQFFDLPTVKLPKMGEGLVYYPPRFKEAKRTTYAAMAWNIFKAMTMFPAIDLYRGPDLTAGQWLEKRRYQDLGRDFVALPPTNSVISSTNAMNTTSQPATVP